MTLSTERLAIRAMRKLLRVLALVRVVIVEFGKYGAQSAFRRYHSIRAVMVGDWSQARSNQRAMLLYRANTCEAPIKQFFNFLECEQVDDLTLSAVIPAPDGLVQAFARMTFRECNDLYEYFRYFGDFRIANLLRKQTLLAAIRAQKSTAQLNQLALSAALEIGQPEVALEFLHNCRSNNRLASSTNEFKALAHCQLREYDAASAIWNSEFERNDRAFHEFIHGKSVAIVGPAPPQVDVGARIDEHDIVVRTNYRVGSNFPVQHFGSRTDVTYYNHFRMASHRNEVIAASQDVPWVVLKGNSDQAIFSSLSPRHVGSCRSAFTPHHVFFGSSAPMAIQIIMNDLIRFSPGKITLFCTNFYMAKESYGNNYRVNPMGAAEMSESLRIHEPFSCFRFSKNLFQFGVCEADELTAAVLKLTSEEYSSELNRLYGKHVLPV